MAQNVELKITGFRNFAHELGANVEKAMTKVKSQGMGGIGIGKIGLVITAILGLTRLSGAVTIIMKKLMGIVEGVIEPVFRLLLPIVTILSRVITGIVKIITGIAMFLGKFSTSSMTDILTGKVDFSDAGREINSGINMLTGNMASSFSEAGDGIIQGGLNAAYDIELSGNAIEQALARKALEISQVRIPSSAGGGGMAYLPRPTVPGGIGSLPGGGTLYLGGFSHEIMSTPSANVVGSGSSLASGFGGGGGGFR